MQNSIDFAATLLTYCMLCFFFFCHPFIIPSAAIKPIDFTGDVALNCGFHKNSAGFDGREWIAERLHHEPKGKSTSSWIPKDKLFYGDPIPYMTARISRTQFSYTFQVNPGQKFIRLHFYPSSFYHGFENHFIDFFTVEAGSFTLLRNFSASFATESLGVTYLVKEFCLNVEEGSQKLRITFTPYQGIVKQRKTYAFVNGIEIISMPTGLYYTQDGDSGVPIVGPKNRFYYIDNSTALELIQRLNIGGSFIPPGEDFGMFRSWIEDSNYLVTSKLESANHLVRGIKFTNIPAFTATLKIYQTSWKVGKNERNHHRKLKNFTWKIPLDVGFAYLLRLHFCDVEEVEMSEDDGQRNFSVLVNSQVVDVMRLISNGVPIYSDYVVILKGHREAGKIDLFLGLQSSDGSVVRIFHGLEIFKLSNSDNNLASPNNIYLKEVKKSWNGKFKSLLFVLGRKNAIATGMTILIILLNVIVFKLRQLWAKIWYEGKHTGAATNEQQQYHQFSLDEIISATQNFSDELLIGTGGFGNVYKGLIRGVSEEVAIKRLKSNSRQGAREFWTEIEALSKIRHVHLVSLIGYCNDCQEMILVYEYMPCGTLADNLYKTGKNGKDVTPLTWKQRLGICIGAARGLDYLHTGVKYGVIHCDVKDSNILLDQNLVAKVSDFGLSKLGQVNENLSSVSTRVKGTWGYLDPDYQMTHKLTRKTDVYAFGVVLLVVLCGKPAVHRRIATGGDKTLVSSFRKCKSKGEIEDIIDPSLQGKIPSGSLNKFLSCIEHCLHKTPKKRPTMAQVVASLENILEDSQSVSREQSCRKFSLAEIISATENFSEAFLIGKGGFGYVYKGFIHGGSEIVAVKRLKSNYKLGAREFWTEIETLSVIRHKHLVSLIGYVNEYEEMILVYEYMPRGALSDNLYKIGTNREGGNSLTWERRLSILIDAARGLDHLHTEYEIIHCDVNVSNILLDKNFVAKISGFILSKLRNVSESQGKVQGTPGFGNPDYLLTQKLTTKADVYGFGVVMFVVLTGRPGMDRSISGEFQGSLWSLFQEHKRKGNLNAIVDPILQGKISTQSLKEFIKCLENCLQIDPKERPTMSQVATSLEWALENQRSTSGQSSNGEIVHLSTLSPIQEDEFSSSSMDRSGD